MSPPDDLIPLLRSALRGDGPSEARGSAALRMRTKLQPAAGQGAKVMPPTYAPERRGDSPRYVEESRVIDGEPPSVDDDGNETQLVRCTSLDSVASQANRVEEAMIADVEDGRLTIPAIVVDQGEFGRNSAFRFSHRCYDAWIEDALLDGTRFGDTDEWDALASVKRQTVTPLMNRFPSGILLGCWASRSKNPQGTARLPRIVSSEVIGVAAERGERAAGKIDFHNVSREIPVYESASEGERWTLDPERAVQAKGKPVPFRKEGKASEAGYGNVAPSLAGHGGITMRYGLQLSVVSLPALRECRFPENGEPARADRNVAGRMMLAALALRMLDGLVEGGYDLRSGCLLVPEEEPTIELVGRTAEVVASWPLADLDSDALLQQLREEGKQHGFDWDRGDLVLQASDEQLELLKQSLVRDGDDGNGS